MEQRAERTEAEDRHHRQIALRHADQARRRENRQIAHRGLQHGDVAQSFPEHAQDSLVIALDFGCRRVVLDVLVESEDSARRTASRRRQETALSPARWSDRQGTSPRHKRDWSQIPPVTATRPGREPHDPFVHPDRRVIEQADHGELPIAAKIQNEREAQAAPDTGTRRRCAPRARRRWMPARR